MGVRGFPFVTIRDQVEAQVLLSDALGIDRWAAVVGGSMGGDAGARVGRQAPRTAWSASACSPRPRISSADQIAGNSAADRGRCALDPRFNGGDYYDAGRRAVRRGSPCARRLALLGYRSPTELNDRFERSWREQGRARWAAAAATPVESYLDYHGNKFTRRFDANSYLRLVEAMSSHDVGRGRGGVATALGGITARTLVLGIDSDRLFPGRRSGGRRRGHRRATSTARSRPCISSPFGHDAFLIEVQLVGEHLRRLLRGLKRSDVWDHCADGPDRQGA